MAAFIVTQFMLNSAVMWSLMPLVLATTKVMGINPIGAAVLVNISVDRSLPDSYVLPPDSFNHGRGRIRF